MEIIRFLRGEYRHGADYRPVFHAFAEGLARMIRPRRPLARVRAVER